MNILFMFVLNFLSKKAKVTCPIVRHEKTSCWCMQLCLVHNILSMDLTSLPSSYSPFGKNLQTKNLDLEIEKKSTVEEVDNGGGWRRRRAGWWSPGRGVKENM